MTGDEFKDEPEWVIDQFLKRKRDELARKWEEREERLEKLRQKEKALESRSNKRRRTEKDTMTGSSKEVDEDAEWMLDYGDEGADSQTADVFSGLSTEAKEVLARIGLGPLGNRDDDIETTLDDTVKVRRSISDSLETSNNCYRYITHPELILNSLNSSQNCAVRHFRRHFPNP